MGQAVYTKKASLWKTWGINGRVVYLNISETMLVWAVGLLADAILQE